MTYYDEKPVNKWKVAGITVASLVLVTGVSVGIYAANAGTSGVRGAVALHNQNNTAENRVAAEGQWNIAYKDVTRDVANLVSIRKQYGTNDPQEFVITAETACTDAVTNYNELQSQPLTQGWKPASLPLSFDDTTCN